MPLDAVDELSDDNTAGGGGGAPSKGKHTPEKAIPKAEAKKEAKPKKEVQPKKEAKPKKEVQPKKEVKPKKEAKPKKKAGKQEKPKQDEAGPQDEEPAVVHKRPGNAPATGMKRPAAREPEAAPKKKVYKCFYKADWKYGIKRDGHELCTVGTPNESTHEMAS